MNSIRMILALIVIILSAAPALADNPHLNFDFEDGAPGSSPRSWYAGGEGYTGEITTDNPHGGTQCLQLAKTDLTVKGFGIATSSFPLATAAGHKLRYTGWIRSAGITEGYAGLWWRVDGPDGMLVIDNMRLRGVTGDTEWTQYTIELDIAPEVTNINFGCILPGNGTAWFDDLQVELDGVVYDQIRPDPFLANETQVAWIADTAHAFVTDDPTHDNSDLSFVRDMVGDARIVALGEGTHGTAEFFRMKHRLTRYLAEEMGFTLFGIEATMPEAELINNYLRTGEGDPAELIAGMYFWTWRTEEVLAMVQWMRQYNVDGGQLEFHGIDMQSPGLAMKTVIDFVEVRAPDMLLKTVSNYAELRGLIQAKQSSGRPTIPDRIAAATIAITDDLISRRTDLAQAAPVADIDWIIQNARLVAQYCQVAGGDFGARDLFMADNADWLLAQADPEARIVLWAHNGHVSRFGYSGRDAMGTHLARRHGSDMVVFGFCFHEGTYTAFKRGESLGSWGTSPSRSGTLEWAFHQTAQPRLMLDLRGAVPGSAASGWVSGILDYRSIGSMAMDDAFTPGIMADHFDVLIFFETSTPSVLLDIETPSQWAGWDE